MPLSPDFIAYAEELIAGFGRVEIKKMFGGASIGRGGVGFAILDDDTFFIRADPAFGAELKAQGCRPWVYSVKKEGTVRDIAYWSMPAGAADDADEAVRLVKRSFEISKKVAAEKGAKPKKAAKAPAKAVVKKAPAKKAAKARAKK